MVSQKAKFQELVAIWVVIIIPLYFLASGQWFPSNLPEISQLLIDLFGFIKFLPIVFLVMYWVQQE